VPVEVGIVGLPSAGKTTLFTALTGVAAEATGYGKPHVGMASIPDERVERLAEVAGSAKATLATLRIVDVPGTEAATLGGVRGCDALVAVLNSFATGSDPVKELLTLELELVVADSDHVQRRLERVSKQAKSGEPALKQEVAQLEVVLAHLDSGKPLRDFPDGIPGELEPLTTKPLIAVENGPGGIDAKLEAELAELAELDEEEAAAFREGPSALDQIIPRVYAALDLLSFFTANENEARAWPLERGRTVLDAAGSIHTDMARGFVRCEVVRWDDLVESGSHAEAARRGLVRLEGKGYVVEDGDVLQIRFTRPR
jgi:ribosome-binding ATPase YchF (GTP1/OBG family)